MFTNLRFRFMSMSFFILFIMFAGVFMSLPARAHAASVDNWWPVNNASVDGVQPFKGLLESMPLNQYYMFWEVDNGQYNIMQDNQADYPHKEAMVDLSSWNWSADGTYHINFIAQDLSGHEIARTSFVIHHGSSAPVQTVAQPVVTQAFVQVASLPVISQPVVTTPPPAPVAQSAPVVLANTSNKLFVDPNSPALAQAASWASSDPADAKIMQEVGSQSTAVWYGGWNGNIASDVRQTVQAAAAQNALATLVAYNIPGRDCGGFSAGGATDSSSYLSWIGQFAQGLGNNKAIVVLEPDSLAGIDCLSPTQQSDRYTMLNSALNIIHSADQNAAVYLDAGHSGWVDTNEMANRLTKAGIAKASGFSLNVSNFASTADNTNYGQSVSQKLGGAHFIIDTSRNGNGSDGEWCNPQGRALGQAPTLSTGNSIIDAYLWVKRPGESDGNCNGGPSAGVWWPSYALDLAKRAGY